MKQRGVMNTNTMENFFAGIMAGIMAFGILMLSIFPTAFLFKITFSSALNSTFYAIQSLLPHL